MSKIKNRLYQMAQLLNKYSDAYYNKSISLVTDAEYDQLFQEYQLLEKENPNIKIDNSPTKNVGSKVNSFNKANHITPMLSLSNAFELDDVKNFIVKVKKILRIEDFPEIVCEPKIDGVSFSLIYENGILVKALSRGDGLVGEVITDNIKTIGKIPLKISVKTLLEIRGEAFITKKDFKKLNLEQLKYGRKNFSNPRNVASGSLRHLDSAVAASRPLKYFVYSIGNNQLNNVVSQIELLSFLQSEGFEVNPIKNVVNNINGIDSFYNKMLKSRDDLDYEIDGIVYKINNFAYQNRLGFITRVPRFAIAHKFPAVIGCTKLNDIRVQVGRTGVITPVAILDPINIGGVNVARATLHNYMEIERKDIRVGDFVFLERAGDVIPKVRSVDFSRRKNDITKFDFPSHCPSCGSILKKENKIIRCPNNIFCSFQSYMQLCHFISKKGMNIDGFGKKHLKFLIDQGYIKNYIDIFGLENLNNDDLIKLQQFEGFGKKSIANLINAISKAKKVKLDRFIYAIGLPNIGEINSKILAKHYKNISSFINKVISISKGDKEEISFFEQIDGMGQSTIEDIKLIFQNTKNIILLKELTKILDILPYQENLSNHILSGKIIVFTGTMVNFSRIELKNIAEKLGAKIGSQVSKNTNFLVCGNNPGSKLNKAKELNIKIINEEEWQKMI